MRQNHQYHKEEVKEKEKSDKAKRKERKLLKIQKQKEVDALLDKHRADPKFQEFLRIALKKFSEIFSPHSRISRISENILRILKYSRI